MIAALFVETDGPYYDLPEVDPWDKNRDARSYTGEHPVVAHPPCQLWGPFAPINYKRWGGEHNKPGNDGGCFKCALADVRRCGGVLEHPAKTKAWAAHGLERPTFGKWVQCDNERTYGGWVTEVWQSAYGHQARKATWLYYASPLHRWPLGLSWQRIDGTLQIGFHDQRGKAANKPTISGKKASETPPAFRDVLISLASYAAATCA